MYKVIFLSTLRLHRNKAILIHTLKQADALNKIFDVNVKIYMPPYKKKGLAYQTNVVQGMKISRELSLTFSPMLHSRWKTLDYLPFLFLKRKSLKNSFVFVTSHIISRGLIKLGIPHLFEVHEFNPLREKNFLKKITKCVNNGKIKLVCISPSIKELLINSGVDSNKVHVLPVGVDIGLFYNIEQLTVERFKDPTIIHAGTLDYDRGLSILEHLANMGYKFILAGKITGRNSWPSSVQCLGMVPHSEIPTLYSKCEIALLPFQPTLFSANSFCSQKLIESMAAGRAIIASDLKPIRDVVTHGKEALLVSPSDISSWINAIETLKKNPELAITLAKNARQKAKDFDWSKRAEKILSIFRGEGQAH